MRCSAILLVRIGAAAIWVLATTLGLSQEIRRESLHLSSFSPLYSQNCQSPAESIPQLVVLRCCPTTRLSRPRLLSRTLSYPLFSQLILTVVPFFPLTSSATKEACSLVHTCFAAVNFTSSSLSASFSQKAGLAIKDVVKLPPRSQPLRLLCPLRCDRQQIRSSWYVLPIQFAETGEIRRQLY